MFTCALWSKYAEANETSPIEAIFESCLCLANYKQNWMQLCKLNHIIKSPAPPVQMGGGGLFMNAASRT